jgi:curved DNA-binding protein CbpA
VSFSDRVTGQGTAQPSAQQAPVPGKPPALPQTPQTPGAQAPAPLAKIEQPKETGLQRQSTLAKPGTEGAKEKPTKPKTTAAVDHAKTLGVDPNASKEEVQAAFRKEASKWHPDKWDNASPEEQKKANDNIRKVNAARDAFAAKFDTATKQVGEKIKGTRTRDSVKKATGRDPVAEKPEDEEGKRAARGLRLPGPGAEGRQKMPSPRDIEDTPVGRMAKRAAHGMNVQGTAEEPSASTMKKIDREAKKTGNYPLAKATRVSQAVTGRTPREMEADPSGRYSGIGQSEREKKAEKSQRGTQARTAQRVLSRRANGEAAEAPEKKEEPKPEEKSRTGAAVGSEALSRAEKRAAELQKQKEPEPEKETGEEQPSLAQRAGVADQEKDPGDQAEKETDAERAREQMKPETAETVARAEGGPTEPRTLRGVARHRKHVEAMDPDHPAADIIDRASRSTKDRWTDNAKEAHPDDPEAQAKYFHDKAAAWEKSHHGKKHRAAMSAAQEPEAAEEPEADPTSTALSAAGEQLSDEEAAERLRKRERARELASWRDVPLSALIQEWI